MSLDEEVNIYLVMFYVNTDNKVNKTDIALLLLDVLVVIFLNFETQNICINQNWTANVPLLNISSTKVMDWMDWTNRMGKKTSVYIWYIYLSSRYILVLFWMRIELEIRFLRDVRTFKFQLEKEREHRCYFYINVKKIQPK